MFEFPEVDWVPLDKWIDAGVAWLTVDWRFEFFRAISGVILWTLVRIERFLEWLPPGIFILILVLLAWQLGGTQREKTPREATVMRINIWAVSVGLFLLWIPQHFESLQATTIQTVFGYVGYALIAVAAASALWLWISDLQNDLGIVFAVAWLTAIGVTLLSIMGDQEVNLGLTLFIVMGTILLGQALLMDKALQVSTSNRTRLILFGIVALGIIPFILQYGLFLVSGTLVFELPLILVIGGMSLIIIPGAFQEAGIQDLILVIAGMSLVIGFVSFILGVRIDKAVQYFIGRRITLVLFTALASAIFLTIRLTLWALAQNELAAFGYPLLSLTLVIVLAFWTFDDRRPGLVELAIAGPFFIGVIGLWPEAMETLAVVGIATLISVAIAIPTGILMAESDRVQSLIRPILDGAQTMPSFVYLVPALMLFGLGKVPAVIATVIYAVPPGIRLTNLGIRLVSPEIKEAARAFGVTPRQMLLKVELPLARPTIMTGVNQTIMNSLAMVVIASLVGAAGLGVEVLHGIARLKVGQGFNGGISIVLLAIVIDRITRGLGRERRRSKREE